MITNFEELTVDITEEEQALASKVQRVFTKHHVGSDNAVKSPRIEKALGISGVRLRKIINWLRRKEGLPLIATSKGYYISYDRVEVLSFIQSMNERAAAIEAVANALTRRLETTAKTK